MYCTICVVTLNTLKLKCVYKIDRKVRDIILNLSTYKEKDYYLHCYKHIYDYIDCNQQQNKSVLYSTLF